MANSQTAHKEQQLIQVIEMLTDGDSHSGQKIADELGVSRAYVWKLIQQLQDYGLELESVPGKGYVWPNPSALITEEHLRTALAHLNLSAEVHLATDSSNQRLKENFQDKHLVVAEYQTEGRGRRGRNWQSPLATNLYFSYGWKTDLPVQQLGGLSLVVGVSIAQALENLGFGELKLKWPNDVRYHKQKLAGILVELTGDADGDLEVIIGVGINVNMYAEQDAIDQEWVSLSQIKQESISREQVLITIVETLVGNLNLFEANGFQFFAKAWNQYDEVINTPVTIHQAKNDVEGIAKGVDLSGALVLDVDGELQSIFAGDVSMRPKASS